MALGTLSAGLMHELNNPGTAAHGPRLSCSGKTWFSCRRSAFVIVNFNTNRQAEMHKELQIVR